MNNGLYSGVSAMQVAESRMDTVTANLANLSTPAFKRLGSATESFVVREEGRDVPKLGTRQVVDFSQGDLSRTGNTTDLALMGDGFFGVDGPEGEMYTRNGSFRLSDGGVLQTAEGYPVAWESSQASIDSVGQRLTIDANGTARQGQREIGRLKVVSFENPQDLAMDRQGYLHAGQGMFPVASDAEVHQGALERSNASAIDELVTMIQVQRSFEVATNLLKSIDQSYQRLMSPQSR